VEEAYTTQLCYFKLLLLYAQCKITTKVLLLHTAKVSNTEINGASKEKVSGYLLKL
jgi:hypothetical protein